MSMPGIDCGTCCFSFEYPQPFPREEGVSWSVQAQLDRLSPGTSKAAVLSMSHLPPEKNLYLAMPRGSEHGTQATFSISIVAAGHPQSPQFNPWQGRKQVLLEKGSGWGGKGKGSLFFLLPLPLLGGAIADRGMQSPPSCGLQVGAVVVSPRCQGG